jgi:hypothetical protein
LIYKRLNIATQLKNQNVKPSTYFRTRHDESNSQVASRGIISVALTMFVPGLVSYFQDRQLVENSKDAIREARGAYASLEFFTRNFD